jgi:hypothetical protein
LQPLALFQYVACRFSKNGLRAVLFCLENAQSQRFCGQLDNAQLKNAAAPGDNRSRLTKVMPL